MGVINKKIKRVVIKIGSSLFYSGKNKLNLKLFDQLVTQLVTLKKEGKEVVVVSSGSIALGLFALKLEDRPKELAYLQAAAAIGQNELMHLYDKSFKKKKIICAQVLLTWEDFSDRKRYLNAKNTLSTLLKLGVIPIINENDTISTDEIKFGDNDQLSSLVASLTSADLLIILSDVDGLLDKDMKTVIRLIDNINGEISSKANSTDKSTSVGGMITKIKAARVCTESGIACVIANGRKKDILISLANDPTSVGSLFVPKDATLSERQRWMAFSTKPKGKIIVDDGAKKALNSKKSLLAVGVCSIDGSFKNGDIVSVIDKDGCEFGRGKIDFSADELCKVKGEHCDKEVIHCDNIAIF